MRDSIYYNRYLKQLNVETALVDATYYPLSGSFIDTALFRRVAFIIHVGAIDTATTFQVRQDTSATVTASVKVLTGAVWIAGTGDDNQDAVIEFDTSQLDVNNAFRYVSLYVTGPTGNDYAAIAVEMWLGSQPVTQPTTFPSDNSVILG